MCDTARLGAAYRHTIRASREAAAGGFWYRAAVLKRRADAILREMGSLDPDIRAALKDQAQ